MLKCLLCHHQIQEALHLKIVKETSAKILQLCKKMLLLQNAIQIEVKQQRNSIKFMQFCII